MALPQLVTVRDFTTSRYAQLVENLETPLNDILVRAEAAIQSRLGLRIFPSTYTEQWRAQSSSLFVRHRPIISVTSIRRRPSILSAWETVDPSRYRFEAEPGYIEMYSNVNGFEVEVTYVAGIATVPEDVREAIIMQAVLFSVQDLEVYGTGDSRAPGYIDYIRQDIDMILAEYKQTGSVWH